MLVGFVFIGACQKSTQKDSNSIDLNAVAVAEENHEKAECCNVIDASGMTLETRILPWENFKRTDETADSFAKYLRSLPLKPDGAEVLYYDGLIKPNDNTYSAVIDLKIGNKNLHQCADAVMRLRAEYLWEQKRYQEIHFNFTNGFRVDYSKWMKGQRIELEGNRSFWVDKAAPSNTYKSFWKYLEVIFNYAGTLSLSKELTNVNIEEVKIGDVFILGGSPGHAVLVIDMAVHMETGKKTFLLAQSFMPAQEIQILQNPNNSELSPWYVASEIGDQLITPEWIFTAKDLKRFVE